MKEARTFFAIRSQTVRTVQMNYKHNPEYVLNGWKCPCGEDDHQSHLLHCLQYEHLRRDLNLESNDHDLVLYFQRIVREREKKGMEISEEIILPSFHDSSHDTSHDISRDDVILAPTGIATNRRKVSDTERDIVRQQRLPQRGRGEGGRIRDSSKIVIQTIAM